MKILLLIATALPLIACRGAPHAINASLSDPNVVVALSEINALYKTNGDQRLRVGVRVVSATSQIVAGVKYTYTIEVTGGDENELCTVSLLSQLWITETLQVIDGPTCVPKNTGAAPRTLVGGAVDVSFTDADVQEAVQYLESRLNARSNGIYYLKATAASRVTKQIVNGVIYRFYGLTYAESQCTQNEVRQDANKLCTISATSPVRQLCSYEVYYNPREATPYTINSEVCSVPSASGL